MLSVNEKDENEHELLDIYKFTHSSPPIRFIRLVQTDKNWKNKNVCGLVHFDIFGSLSLESTGRKNNQIIKTNIGRFFKEP